MLEEVLLAAFAVASVLGLACLMVGEDRRIHRNWKGGAPWFRIACWSFVIAMLVLALDMRLRGTKPFGISAERFVRVIARH